MLVSRNFGNDSYFLAELCCLSFSVLSLVSSTSLVPSWAITTKNTAALLRHFHKENVSY